MKLPAAGLRRGGEGIDNLDAYLATNPEQPMPRLLLVVDEFAMLAKEYPTSCPRWSAWPPSAVRSAST